MIAGFKERRRNLQTLGKLQLLLLRGFFAHAPAPLDGQPFDVAQALATDFRLRDFDPALVANHAAVLHAFVLAAETFPIRNGSKDAGAKQTIALGFERAVIDRLGLGYFTVRPLTDLFR